MNKISNNLLALFPVNSAQRLFHTYNSFQTTSYNLAPFWIFLRVDFYGDSWQTRDTEIGGVTSMLTKGITRLPIIEVSASLVSKEPVGRDVDEAEVYLVLGTEYRQKMKGK